MTILITGANRGLGLATARALAESNATPIVLAGRDMEALEHAVADLRRDGDGQSIYALQLDLSDLNDVRAAVARFKKLGLPPLSALICNAGISRVAVDARSTDGFELTFAVNHLGHFLLVHLLLAQMAQPSRIIMVSSGVHDAERASGPMQPPRYVKAEYLAYPERDPDQPTHAAVAGGQAYASSKLCNVLFTHEMVRQLAQLGMGAADAGVAINAYGPGLLAGTGLGRDGSGMTRFMWYVALPLLQRFFGMGRNLSDSGADLAFLATADELEQTTGQYFEGREPVQAGREAFDQVKATDLWVTSLELTELTAEESIWRRAFPAGGDVRQKEKGALHD